MVRSIIENIHIPELKTIDLSLSEVKAMSDDELLAVIAGESRHEGFLSAQLQQLITAELIRRNLEKASKPHWSVTPSFWLLIIGTSAACIAAYPVLFPQPQVQQPAAPIAPSAQTSVPGQSKPSSSQLPSLNSPQRKAAQQ